MTNHYANLVNVSKYKLVNAVMADFNTNMRQMTKTSQQKKQAGGYQ